MITLAIDTSTPRGAVALLRDDKPLAEEAFDRSKPRQNLFDVTAGLLSLNGLSAKDLELLAIGLGPGSFTGIRAGIAAVKGLALPFRLPIKGVSSFDAIAVRAAPKMPHDCIQMCVLCDARRGEVYYALYDREGKRVNDCRIGMLEAIADEIHNPMWFVSSEITQFKDKLAALFGGFASICDDSLFPGAGAIGRLAVRRFYTDGKRGDEVLEPIYLRIAQYKTL